MEKSINSHWTSNKFLLVLFSEHFLCFQYLRWERGPAMMVILVMCRCKWETRFLNNNKYAAGAKAEIVYHIQISAHVTGI